MSVLLGIVLLASCLTVGVEAQSKTTGPTQPDWRLDPTYGSINLSSGFTPDPDLTWVTAGGNINLNNMGYSGYVAEAPDIDFYYEAGMWDLYIYVTEQDADTVLLINGPNQEWYFNDDGAGGTRPGIHISSPDSGLYSIWIGTYGSTMVEAQIAISEMDWDSSSSSGGATPDWSLASSYGTVRLSSGFTPDPNVTSVLAGGSISLSSLGFSGYVAEAPDLDLQYSAGAFDLYIYVSEHDEDTVLLVNTPSGNWLYDDDSADGLQPGIEIRNPESGLYNIWVGTYGSSMVNADVAISEIHWDSSSGGGGADLEPDFWLDPTYGSVDLAGGFKTPYRLDVIAGGEARAYTVGYSGYVAEAPDLSVQYNEVGRPLYVWLERNSGDTVLLINTPNGEWLFNDDASGLGLGSGIVINYPDTGRYDIWAGTLDGSYVDATIVISEFGW